MDGVGVLSYLGFRVLSAFAVSVDGSIDQFVDLRRYLFADVEFLLFVLGAEGQLVGWSNLWGLLVRQAEAAFF